MQETIRFLRHIWDDTGWRTAIIASFLTFLLETFMVVGEAPVGTSLMWTAMLVSLILISRGLTLRPLRCQLSDVENISLLLGIAGLVTAQVIYIYTSVGPTFIDQPIFWPFSLVFALIQVCSRLIAPHLLRPLNIWLLVLMFLYFWMTVGTWTAEAVFPEPPFTWSVALIAFAFIGRWIAGRGLAGPITSPLNVATGLFVVLTLWLEFGAQISGVGADPWGLQELYWPWLLVTGGLAFGCRIVAPHVSARIGGAD